MEPFLQFMRDTGWVALACLAVLSVFLRFYWGPRVVTPKAKAFEAMGENEPGRTQAALWLLVLAVPGLSVFIPMLEELIFRAPLFVWGPSFSEAGQWRLFLISNAVFLAVHPQYHLDVIGKALAAADLEAERRTTTAEDAHVILPPLRRERVMAAIPGMLGSCLFVVLLGFVAWWSGSYWTAVLVHALANLQIVKIPVMTVVALAVLIPVLILVEAFERIRFFLRYKGWRNRRWLPRVFRKNMW